MLLYNAVNSVNKICYLFHTGSCTLDVMVCLDRDQGDSFKLINKQLTNESYDSIINNVNVHSY